MNKILIDSIINNGGATLDKELKNITSKNGYMVSIQGKELTYNISNNINYDTIIKTIKDYQLLISKYDNYFVGMWVDNDLLYIDISIKINNKRNALKFAKRNNQLAIYDIKNGTSIYLKVTTYSIYNYYIDSNNQYCINELLAQYEDMHEVARYCNSTYNNIKMNKNKGTLISGMYYVFSKTYNASELM